VTTIDLGNNLCIVKWNLLVSRRFYITERVMETDEWCIILFSAELEKHLESADDIVFGGGAPIGAMRVLR
jgi:hypothetical protein